MREEVRAACEVLGLDPLYVANEGKCLAIVAKEVADAVLQTMRGHRLGREAEIIGEVVDEHPGQVASQAALRIGSMVSMGRSCRKWLCDTTIMEDQGLGNTEHGTRNREQGTGNREQ